MRLKGYSEEPVLNFQEILKVRFVSQHSKLEPNAQTYFRYLAAIIHRMFLHKMAIHYTEDGLHKHEMRCTHDSLRKKAMHYTSDVLHKMAMHYTWEV